ncbi:hypothetical protein NDU88_001372 [Pleurodeles waltl]|uniref:Uncharacterized protein n=1 Tax=Pleurodeles waltl TaxID=8319 RepID=A0AAV7VW98_PLEWA|nr:hypothetical protein NDU88_001372 [Pleurodeles waltl]
MPADRRVRNVERPRESRSPVYCAPGLPSELDPHQWRQLVHLASGCPPSNSATWGLENNKDRIGQGPAATKYSSPPLHASSDREVCFKDGTTDCETVATGLVELVKTFPSTLKINMAPKAARNSGSKAEGSKITHTGKDKGDSAGAVRRPITTAAKLSGKNTTSVGEDFKNDDGITPPLEVRGKAKSSPQSYLILLQKRKKITPNILCPRQQTVSL